MSEIDPSLLKARQRKLWDAVAAGWEKWWPTIEAAAQPVSERLCELARVGEGHWVLDFATGIGEPALTAARRVGPSGKVTAVDQAPAMLAIAERRIRQAGLANVGVHAADAEALLGWPEKSYDAVLCRWGLMFMPALSGALRAILRLLVPGGWFATATWASIERVPFCGVARGPIEEILGLPPPAPGTPHGFALSDPEALARSFAQAGFRDVQGERLVLTYEFDSPEAYAAFLRDASPVSVEVAARPPEVEEQVWKAVAEAARPFAGADGRVALPAEALLTAGRR